MLHREPMRRFSFFIAAAPRASLMLNGKLQCRYTRPELVPVATGELIICCSALCSWLAGSRFRNAATSHGKRFDL